MWFTAEANTNVRNFVYIWNYVTNCWKYPMFSLKRSSGISRPPEWLSRNCRITCRRLRCETICKTLTGCNIFYVYTAPFGRFQVGVIPFITSVESLPCDSLVFLPSAWFSGQRRLGNKHMKGTLVPNKSLMSIDESRLCCIFQTHKVPDGFII